MGEMKVFNVGLVKGRHEMPVDSYIFDEIEDPMDFKGMEDKALAFFQNLLKDVEREETENIRFCYPAHFVDITEFRENAELVIYITGLTSALTSALRVATMLFRSVKLMHFDLKTSTYKTQVWYTCNLA